MQPDNFIVNTRVDGYSDQVGKENDFCVVPNTGDALDYHVIGPDLAAATGMLQIPIRLVNGKHFGSGGGYGIAHMLYNHARTFALWDFFSVQDYVAHVSEGFDAVYAGRSNRFIIVRRKEPSLAVDRLLVLELSPLKEYYSVVTGWPQSARRPVNGTLIAEQVRKDELMVWECRAPHSSGPG